MTAVWTIQITTDSDADEASILRVLLQESGVMGVKIIAKAKHTGPSYKHPKPGPDFYG